MKSKLPALHAAAGNGDLTKAKSLLAEGVDLEARDQAGWTALLWAIENGHYRLVELLLKAGADPNNGRRLTPGERWARSKKDKLETPLSLAALLGDLRTLELLHQAGARLEGSACESVACMNTMEGGQKHLAAVRWLLDAGLSPRAAWKGIPLARHAKSDNRKGILEKLASMGVLPPRDRPEPGTRARRAAKSKAGRSATDFISFIHATGHPEWVVLAVEAPVEKVVDALAAAHSRKDIFRQVPIRPAGKRDDEIAPLVPVIRCGDTNWSLVYRVVRLPIGEDDFDSAKTDAVTLSSKLKTKALAFFGEDTAYAMGYELYRAGKPIASMQWEDQNDEAVDEAFDELGIALPVFFPRRKGRSVWLAAREPWVKRIARADVLDFGDRL